jgi:hypothetical protein
MQRNSLAKEFLIVRAATGVHAKASSLPRQGGITLTAPMA